MKQRINHFFFFLTMMLFYSGVASASIVRISDNIIEQTVGNTTLLWYSQLNQTTGLTYFNAENAVAALKIDGINNWRLATMSEFYGLLEEAAFKAFPPDPFAPFFTPTRAIPEYSFWEYRGWLFSPNVNGGGTAEYGSFTYFGVGAPEPFAPWAGGYGAINIDPNTFDSETGYFAVCTPVPIPAAFILLGTGVAGLITARRFFSK